MTERKSKEPIEAFGPQLMAALVAGGRGRVVIKFEQGDGVGKKFAHTFQRRIHTLRQRMRELNHPDYAVAMRAQVRLVWGPKAVKEGASPSWIPDDRGIKGAWVIITPRDSEFNSALAASGVHVDGVVSHSELPTPSPTTSPSAARAKEDYDALMDELEQINPGDEV